jgi:hypothetical protein
MPAHAQRTASHGGFKTEQLDLGSFPSFFSFTRLEKNSLSYLELQASRLGKMEMRRNSAFGKMQSERNADLCTGALVRSIW